MECKKCNAPLSAEDKFCPICGEPVENIEIIDNIETINPIQETSNEVNRPIQVPSDAAPIVDDINNNMVSENLMSSNVATNNFEHKKGKTGLTILIVAIVIVLLGICGFIYFVSRSPKMVFNSFVGKVYEKLDMNVVDVKTLSGSFSLQTKISTQDDSNEIFEFLNKVFIGADYEIDYNNKTMLIKLNTKYDNEELLNADMYLKDQKAYVLLKGIYDEYISTDVEGFDDSIFDEMKFTSDHRTILEEVKNALTKSLRSEYFDKENADITINGKQVKTTKNSLVLDAKTVKSIAKDFLTYLKDNDAFITSASNVTDMSKDDIIASINEGLSSIETLETTNTDSMLVSLYTKGLKNDIVRVEISYNEDGEKQYIAITEESDNKALIDSSINGQKITGIIEVKETNGKQSVEISFTDSESKTTIGLILSSSAEYNKSLSSINTNNSIDISELTEDEYYEITSKLMEKEGVQQLIEAFSGLSFGYDDSLLDCEDYDDPYCSYDSDDDYDYDYDYGYEGFIED